MSRITLLTAALLTVAAPAFAAGIHQDEHAETADTQSIGRPGDAADVSRTIEITMTETDDGEMLFAPRDLTFTEGETVRFVVANAGEQEHEFVLDTAAANQEHKDLMARFPEMEHDDPNAIRLEPGQDGEIVWTFANAGTFEFACLMLGHYESGMHGPIVVE